MLLSLLGVVLGPGLAEADIKATKKVFCYHARDGSNSVFNYEIQDVHKERLIDWDQYRGKVTLVVNVASF